MTALLGDAPSALDRFSSPLYTVAEAERYLDVPASTLASWARGYWRAGKGRPEVTGSPVLTTVTSPAVADMEWLELAGQQGWPVLTKDERIRYRPSERAAVVAHRIQACCRTGGNRARLR